MKTAAAYNLWSTHQVSRRSFWRCEMPSVDTALTQPIREFQFLVTKLCPHRSTMQSMQTPLPGRIGERHCLRKSFECGVHIVMRSFHNPWSSRKMHARTNPYPFRITIGTRQALIKYTAEKDGARWRTGRSSRRRQKNKRKPILNGKVKWSSVVTCNHEMNESENDIP